MKRMTSLLPIFLLSLTSFAAGDSVPVYNLTQGVVTVTVNPVYGGVDLSWTFGNSGVSISGMSFYLGTQQCFTSAVAGASCDPSFSVVNGGLPTPNMGKVSGSDTVIFFGGTGVDVSAGSFITPSGTDLTSFSVTIPVLFSGSFSACAAGGQGVNAGCYDPTKGVTNPVFAIFNVYGTGTGNLSFIKLGYPDVPMWRLSSGTYTLNPVPEPGSIMLLGTGAVGLILRLRRKI